MEKAIASNCDGFFLYPFAENGVREKLFSNDGNKNKPSCVNRIQATNFRLEH